MTLLEFRCQHAFANGFRLHIDFQLDHRFTALFGPSGAGKTTILSIIAGFLTPQQGYVRVGDTVLLDTQQRLRLPAARRAVGVVFQDALLFPHLNVEANLRYGQRYRKNQARSIAFERAVDVLEIGHLLARFPRNLSGGERQRVALGRALLSGPELLLMDEPMASLDAPLKTRILAYLEQIVAQWNVPTLYITHSQAEVRRAAQHVIVVQQGQLVTAGSPDEALGQPGPLGWGNDAGPTNLVRLDHTQSSTGGLIGWIGSQALSLPPQTPGSRLPSFVQFSPGDIIVCRRDIADVSARNHVRGRVCRLAPTDQAVFVAIDIGPVIWAEVTPAAARELELHPGMDVVCLVKTHSLKLID